ncbi:hypothetical protein PCASD_18632 [Puccinia coronata f. sp. avenae]|uniref:Uncharacterized protein n=1 Tax=Puccinia coronata f. sp. avenae TaxID=200324 RepID=A0A2N5TU36_9BASI|nr:hypothetical protein PCASD_18632 [Puccinia coronata f. sp. avenae]
MRGVSIKYGAARKEQINVPQSLGWEKKRKWEPNPAALPKKLVCHTSENNGRPPDTTDTLLPELKSNKKIGRPRGARNIDRGVFSTYPSYRASNQPHLDTRSRNISFYNCSEAFYLADNVSVNTRRISPWYDLERKASIFQHAHNLHPDEFVPGKESSADFFIELVLDPNINPNPLRRGLFDVEERQSFSCLIHPNINSQEVWSRYFLHVKKEMFEANDIACGNVAKLLLRWTSVGIAGITGIYCKLCTATRVKPTLNFKKILSYISVAPSGEKATKEGMYHEVLTLHFPAQTPPLHLYFKVDVAPIINSEEQQAFMSKTDWPFAISICGEKYTLFSWGYWSGRHFWSKVLMNVSSITGVWYHNDLDNNGLAHMVSSDVTSIGGCHPFTSWVMYSRGWTTTEKEFVNKKIIQIKKDFSNAKPNQIAFANLSGLLDEGNKFLDSQKRDDVQKDELVASHHSTEMQMPKDGPRKTASNQHAGSKQQTQAILADSSQKPAESTPEQQALPKFQRLKIKVGPQAKPVAVLPQPKDPSDPASIPVPVPACRPGQRSKRVAKDGKQ